MISPEERLKAFQAENHITTKGPLSLVVQFTWSVIIKVKSPNARKGDKIITLRRDSKWENGIQARNAGRR